MTSANGGNYTGQYPCDRWVDNLEPKLLIHLFSEAETPSEENHKLVTSYIKDEKVNYSVVTKIELPIYIPNLFFYVS